VSSLITQSRIEWLNLAGRGYAINPFIGCAYGCYGGCWAYLTARRHGRVKDWQEWLHPELKPQFQSPDLEAQIAREARRLPEDAQLLLSATCDPFQPADLGFDDTIKAILTGLAGVRGKPRILVLTKSGFGLLRFMLWLPRGRTQVGITLTSFTPTEWEPRADHPKLRIDALSTAKNVGFSTYISIEPWLPWVTNPKAIIKATRDFTDSYIVGSFNYTGNKSFYKAYYRRELPKLVAWMDQEKIKYFLKRELLRKAKEA